MQNQIKLQKKKQKTIKINWEWDDFIGVPEMFQGDKKRLTCIINASKFNLTCGFESRCV